MPQWCKINFYRGSHKKHYWFLKIVIWKSSSWNLTKSFRFHYKNIGRKSVPPGHSSFLNNSTQINDYQSLDEFSTWQIDDIFLFFPENRLSHFIQIVSTGDNLHEMLNLFSKWNKKNISKCRLLKFLSSLTRVRTAFTQTYDLPK